MEAPRDDLIRFVPAESRASVTDGRTMTGYPIVFDTFTEINSYEGNFKERIAPGALTKTLRESRDKVKILFNHGADPQIGDKPLGKATTMKADARGLYVEVPLSDTSYNDDLLALMRDGAIDGMSFRFSVVQESWDTPKRGLPERTITELKLYELGPVTFPAYEATTVGIRNASDFAAWRGLTDEKRDEIRRIVGISPEESRTTDDEPPEGTLDESRDETTGEPPEDGHSQVRTSAARRQLVRRALLREKGILP